MNPSPMPPAPDTAQDPEYQLHTKPWNDAAPPPEAFVKLVEEYAMSVRMRLNKDFALNRLYRGIVAILPPVSRPAPAPPPVRAPFDSEAVT